jgi:hypothetical protein
MGKGGSDKCKGAIQKPTPSGTGRVKRASTKARLKMAGGFDAVNKAREDELFYFSYPLGINKYDDAEREIWALELERFKEAELTEEEILTPYTGKGAHSKPQFVSEEEIEKIQSSHNHRGHESSLPGWIDEEGFSAVELDIIEPKEGDSVEFWQSVERAREVRDERLEGSSANPVEEPLADEIREQAGLDANDNVVDPERHKQYISDLENLDTRPQTRLIIEEDGKLIVDGSRGDTLAHQDMKDYTPKVVPMNVEEVAERTEIPVSWQDDPLVAEPGDLLIVSESGSKHPIKKDLFEKTYKELPDGRVTKAAPTKAVQMEGDFVVETLEGRAEGKKGDWLAQGADGECWPIPNETFEKKYQV